MPKGAPSEGFRGSQWLVYPRVVSPHAIQSGGNSGGNFIYLP
jgi:hypothetical protein